MEIFETGVSFKMLRGSDIFQYTYILITGMAGCDIQTANTSCDIQRFFVVVPGIETLIRQSM